MMTAKDKISKQAARLKKIRLYLGRTRKQFGEALGISQHTIASWESGAKSFTTEGARRVVESLKDKINYTCSFDWLMYGTGLSPLPVHEETGLEEYVGIEFDHLHEKLLNEVVNFKRLNKSANVMVVSDNTFSPIAEVGDYVGLLPVDKAKLDNYIGKLVFLALQDDSYKFGVLQKNRGNFRIFYLNSKEYFTVSKEQIDKILQFIWFRKIC